MKSNERANNCNYKIIALAHFKRRLLIKILDNNMKQVSSDYPRALQNVTPQSIEII